MARILRKSYENHRAQFPKLSKPCVRFSIHILLSAFPKLLTYNVLYLNHEVNIYHQHRTKATKIIFIGKLRVAQGESISSATMITAPSQCYISITNNVLDIAIIAFKMLKL